METGEEKGEEERKNSDEDKDGNMNEEIEKEEEKQIEDKDIGIREGPEKGKKMYKVLIVEKGLKLYHISSLNIPENHGDEPHLKLLDKETRYSCNLNESMDFGLSENYPIYFGYWIEERNCWKDATILMETTKDLELLDIGRHPFFGANEKQLIDSGLDGFIFHPDERDNVRIINILRPLNCVKAIKELTFERKEIPCPYPFGKKDREALWGM